MASKISLGWNKTETLCLIKLVGEPIGNNNLSEFSNKTFIEAATKLFEHGFVKTYVQCKNKWKQLVNDYKEYKKDELGPEPMFYIELDRVLSKTPLFTDNFRPWSEQETLCLINIIRDEYYLLEIKDGLHEAAFQHITKELENKGYKIRQKEEIVIRWQQLKAFYKSYIKGEVLNFKYFNVMDNLLDWNSDNIENHELETSLIYNTEELDVHLKETKKKSSNWTPQETSILLSVIKDHNYPNIKKIEKSDMFDRASLMLRSEGYKRSNEQCRLKLKHLRAKYVNALKKQQEMEEVDQEINLEQYCPYFYKIHEIMFNNRNKSEELHEEELTFHNIEFLEDQNDVVPHKINLEHSKYMKNDTWTQRETKLFLKIFNEKLAEDCNNKSLFDAISHELLNIGYKRSGRTCEIKWKILLGEYNEIVKNNLVKNDEISEYFEDINKIYENFAHSEESLCNIVENDHNFDSNNETNDILTIDVDTHSNYNSKRQNLENPSSKRLRTDSVNEDNLVCNYKMDDIQHYCMSLSETFKRLPNIKQAKLKIEIQKLLFKAEFDKDF